MPKLVHMGKARCAADLSDGSERALYVNQDYILRKLGRPHRAVNLMFCYYPYDEGWPTRISDLPGYSTKSGSWDYPYDNYLPFNGEEPFRQMKDVRRHGQDVIATITCDPHITDDLIEGLAMQMRPFGRAMLRLNHEADGNWFSFNKRASYEEVGAFFERFCGIFHRVAPNIRVILCLGAMENEECTELNREYAFRGAVKAADIWSIDKYPSLNYGWPREIADVDNHAHYCYNLPWLLRVQKKAFDRFCFLNGGEKKPLQLCEHNDDGDVTGGVRQAERLKEFYGMVQNGIDGNGEGEDWLTGITLYQFRDDGRLGLEVTDPNNPAVGIEQPELKVYRDLIHTPYYMPQMTPGDEVTLPAVLRWGGSEDADGVELPLFLEQQPTFCEMLFPGELTALNLMLEINGEWFYKAPGTDTVDLMPYFWAHPAEKGEYKVRLFAPPAEGVNPGADTAEGSMNCFTSLPALPDFRVRCAPIQDL